MADRSANLESFEATPAKARQYVVVARRYRPQTFDELIGQEHVARALSNAITTGRVGHAYLFTGARGVGKTSTARILAKALNCQQGTSSTPCNRCDICLSISSGNDVDVLEIDGASNRGIGEIRELRQNVNVRPSRARFKIYIIDEVHMLTREAFNALLKTLEEPPEHVKFIFCTTEPSKIPITILSRCQRFDFAGILTGSIAERLARIVEAEGVSAEPQALEVLARRAAGSMRDAQSLLEQLLAFAPERITVADVHRMLGTAGEERLGALVKHIADRNVPAALVALDHAVQEGVDLGLLLEQLFGYLRDCMAAATGCPADSFLYASPLNAAEVAQTGKRLGLETILAAMQILDQTLSRLRYSTQGRILAELALVRICSLEDLQGIATLIAGLQSCQPSPMVKTSPVPAVSAPPPVSSGIEKNELTIPASGGDGPDYHDGGSVALTQANAAELWNAALSKVSSMAAQHARQYRRVDVPAPNRLVVWFGPGYTLAKSVCERPDQLARFEQALAELTGMPVRIEFSLLEGSPAGTDPPSTPIRQVPPHQRIVEISEHLMIRRAMELFGATPMDAIPPSEK